jgi:UDP-glucose:(heptosyl)LPS alpha-1,3-glucosyltransferase
MSAEERRAVRETLALPADRDLWLWIGVRPLVKGLDRVIAALAGRAAHLVVCGAGADAPGLAQMLQGAARSGCRDRIRILGRVDGETLTGLLGAADLLVHPARNEVTGTVIIEALASGLPVIATEICGHAVHVEAAAAGIVLPEPFIRARLDAALAAATPEQRRRWSDSALAYVHTRELTSGIERAADLILA